MNRADWLRLVLLSMLWGGSFLFIALAVPHLPPLSIALVRVGLAAAVLAAVLAVLRLPLPRGGRTWAALAVMGLVNNALPFTLLAAAQGELDSGLAAILNATSPLFTVLVAHVATTDERLTAGKAAGIALGVVGVAVLTGGFRAAGVPWWAWGAGLLVPFCYALAGVWGRRFARMGVAPLATAFGQTLWATAILALPAALLDRPWALPLPPAPVLAALAALAILSTAVAYLIYFRLLATAGAVNLSLVTFLVPVSAVSLGVLVLGEAPGLRQLAGMVLIAAGLAAIDGRLWRALAGRRPAA
jgi:drug/metabolite transporter (DMT)-like permease